MLTGYTSSTHVQTYGANYFFDRFTYRTIVRSSFSPHHRAKRGAETDWAGNIAWDEHMIGEYNHFCQETMWKPEKSMLYHINSNDALRDEGAMYAERLRAQGKLITLSECESDHMGIMPGVMSNGGPCEGAKRDNSPLTTCTACAQLAA